MKKKETVIITGGSRGIGKTMAIAFALKGYNVLINYNKSEEEAINLYRKLTRKNLPVEIFKADVSIRKEVDAMVDFCISRFNGINILINNAGISEIKLFTDITEKDWNYMMNVSLNGIFNCTQSVLRFMIKKQSGKIINISSVWGMVGASCEVHYSTAKAGVIGFTKALAKELGLSNIKVNCIAPGVIKTEMLEGFSADEIEDLKSEIPLNRVGKPKDIASCALFLASSHSDYLTGQVISPNGGFVV